jgi:hypothetical protein
VKGIQEHRQSLRPLPVDLEKGTQIADNHIEMRKLLLLTCLAVSAFACADDPSVRAMLQAKYDTVDAAMNSGKMHAIADLADPSRFMATDIQKKHQTLLQFLKGLDQKKGVQIKTTVESADTLNGEAKAALRITYTQTVTEKGKSIAYKCTKTEEDTWAQDGDDWKLVAVRLKSNYVTRNGKVVQNESEQVLTDWERQYGRRDSSYRRHHSG